MRDPLGDRFNRRAVDRKIRFDPDLFCRAHGGAQSPARGNAATGEVADFSGKSSALQRVGKVASFCQSLFAAPVSEHEHAESTRSVNEVSSPCDKIL